MDLFYDIQLYRPSFRGVSFEYVTGTTTAGRKTVTHEFPNKTFRYIEDLGNNLRTYSITGEVHGVLWLQQKAALKAVLETEGIGVLVHPEDGAVNCVCTGYTITFDDKEIGVTSFEMTFAEANINIYPNDTGDNSATIANTARDLYSRIGNYINNNFYIQFFRNALDAGERFRLLIEELKAYAEVANATGEDKAKFNVFADSFSSDAYALPNNPSELSERLPEVTNSFDDLSNTVEDRDNINNKAFGFGEDVTPVKLDSPENREKSRNRKIINGSSNAMILANLYANAVLIDYLDDQQLNAKIEDLEDKYERLIFGVNNSLDDDSLNTMQLLRDEWRKFYERLRLTINKIIEIETPRIPLKVLVYQYYGNIDDFSIIMQLNNIRNPALVEGRLKILAQ